VEVQTTRRVVLKNRKLVTERKDLRLQGGTASKTGGHQSAKSDQKRAHRGSQHNLTNDRDVSVFRWDGVFGNHRKIRWDARPGSYLIEWRQDGKRLRAAAGKTPSEALEVQHRKGLELEAQASGLELSGPQVEGRMPLATCVGNFLDDIKAFRKHLTHQRYTYILQLFSNFVAPKSDIRDVTTEDVKRYLTWRKSDAIQVQPSTPTE